MISLWMLYAAGTALLLGMAAHALERVLLARDRLVRWIWVAAVAGSVTIPVTAAVLSLRDGGSLAAGVVIDTEAIRVVAGLASVEQTRGMRLEAERALGTLWFAASLTLLIGLVLSLGILERRQRGWGARRVGGRMVLVSEHTGPAVVRFVWPEIVVPRWVLGLDAAAQVRVIAHEEEHARAGDPWLLLGAAAALVLLPWNVPLWWQVLRLRRAVEVDCDARVLSVLPDARAYGLLLLEVSRRARRVRIPAAAFSEPCSLLEWRIRVLTRSLPWLRGPALASLWAAAALAAASVVALPVPERPHLERIYGAAPPAAPPLAGRNEVVPPAGFSRTAPQEPSVLAPIRMPIPEQAVSPSRAVALPIWRAIPFRPALPAAASFDVAPRLRNDRELMWLVEREYPAPLQRSGVGGTVLLTIRIDRTGRVVGTETLRTSGREDLDLLAHTLLRRADFTPALWQQQPVEVWIQVPITFSPREDDRIP